MSRIYPTYLELRQGFSPPKPNQNTLVEAAILFAHYLTIAYKSQKKEFFVVNFRKNFRKFTTCGANHRSKFAAIANASWHAANPHPNSFNKSLTGVCGFMI
jgi:hypothetical protein